MKKFLLILGISIFIGIPCAQAATMHPPGTLINQQGTIWQISEDGQSRESFDSAEKFFSQRLSFNNVVASYQSDLDLDDNGSIAWGNGVLFNDAGTIYQLSGDKKHGFTSAEVFLGQGFQFSSARPGNLSKLAAGSLVSSALAAHLPGTFVRESNGTVWHINSENKREGVPSLAILTSYEVSSTDFVPANEADLNLSKGDVLSYRTGAIINDGGALWLAAPPRAYPFPSADCFLNFGFRFDMAITGSVAGLSKQTPICGESTFVSKYQQQSVATTRGNFSAHVAQFNLASGKLKLITDTAADTDCSRDCPVTNLAAYVSANGASSGINGTYFCPADYPTCANERNHFFWKVFDTGQNKMINASSGLGENDPFLVMGSDGKLKYFSRWIDARGYPITAGINSAPALISDNKNILNESKLDDKQLTTKANRGALGVKGQILYLVIAQAATIPDLAAIMDALDVDFAMNVDGGGSSALIYQGQYKVGPGRNIPNALLIKTLP